MKHFIRAAVFSFMMMICISGMTYVLRDKTNAEFIYPFWEEEQDTIDVILVGSSKMYRSVYPLELWHAYGITSWNLGSSEQCVPASYHLVKEAFSRQHPKVVVMEVYMSFVENKYYSYARIHQITDNMPFSKNKICMINDLIPLEDRFEFYFPLTLYHGRWQELKKSDFSKIDSDSKGAGYSAGVSSDPRFIILDESRKKDVPKIPAEYIRKTKELCDANGASLILISVPSLGEDEREYVREILNGVDDLAQELGVPYINILYKMQEAGLDYETDYADIHHLNIDGAKKVSAYLGKYIIDHYDIQDRRQNRELCAAWDKSYENALLEQKGKMSNELGH